MVDPVVNSKFGKRPLLEVPALNLEHRPAHMEIGSLQDRHPQMMKYPQTVSMQGQRAQTVPTLAPAGGFPVALPVYGAQQDSVAPFMNAQYVNVQPMNLQAPPYTVVDPSGKPVPAPGQFPVANPAFPVAQPPNYYPSSYPQAPAVIPPPPDNFVLEGQLHYGRLTTLHFRYGNASNFRGLPEYLSMELQKTYGVFPSTDIRVEAQGGAYHVYATPCRRGEREEEEFLYGAVGSRGYTATTYDTAPTESRMVGGFNRVVGHTASNF